MTTTLQLERADLLCQHNIIDGQWGDAASSASFDVTDPADQSLVAAVPDSGAADAWAAVDAASRAFDTWRWTSARERADILKRWHALILEHETDLGRLISREQGKPLAEAIGEVRYAASYVEWFAEAAAHIIGDVIASPDRKRRMLAQKEPVGVVAVITPWNFPAAMIARKIAPALAVGCTVIGKPAEDTPLTALALARLAQDAGLPAGVLNLVCASRANTPSVVDAWLDDIRVRKVSFTGSTAVGKHLAARSAPTLKKLSLELGGNAPFIVFDDADLDAAVEGLIAAKFRNAGQTCISPNRVLVQQGVYADFAERLATRVAALKVGPAHVEGVQIGPLINQRAVEKVMAHLADAQSRGARLLTGGQSIGGNFVQPAVLVGVAEPMLVCREETFGPVLSLASFVTEDEALARANATPFGLAAYFYTREAARIWRFGDRLECGVLGVNEGLVSSAAAPFGGVKESGYGREGSIHGLDDYLHLKYVCQGGLS
jgi:succinate-semialdehyde dehydrogenase/glutarate-semialdehyde dehydrogenase